MIMQENDLDLNTIFTTIQQSNNYHNFNKKEHAGI